MLKEKILQAYADGSDLGYIVECFNITHEEVKKILIDYKESNRFKKTFTDEFKKMVAERDINKVARRQIASELEINFNTVKSACEKFGQAVKERATSDQTYTIVKGVNDLSVCPSCGSKNVNKINSIIENTNTSGIWCKECSDEHFILPRIEIVKVKFEDGKETEIPTEIQEVYKVNFEYLEE